ncbi:hypothetical protein [Tenacibaculum aestuariivivum]|uniref:hypothetical protein n=1 Tax=Tenacibaculum aestuariivivum TaxID=2006131 RepID=UPI003AB4620D
MRRYILLFIISMLSIVCNAQHKKNQSENTIIKQPKGSWKVNREFDKNGNLVRYDSVYSWSSINRFDEFSLLERDSLIQALKNRFFTVFSDFKKRGFEDVFSQDSLFSKHFFNDSFFRSNFGKEFIDIDKIRQEMYKKKQDFLEKYQSEFINEKI